MFDRTASRAKNVTAEIRADRPEIAAVETKLGSRLTIAKNVMRLRIQRGYTQTQLAEMLGVRQPRIAEIESARANLQIDTLDRLAKVFGVETERLLKKERASRRKVVSVPAPIDAASRRDHAPGWERARRAYSTPDLSVEGPFGITHV